MATTTGLVQRLSIIPGSGSEAALACTWIGPNPSSTELLAVRRESVDSPQAGDLKTSIVNALATAQVSRREVTAVHGDSDAIITSLTITPV
jgi:hypothetical protein